MIKVTIHNNSQWYWVEARWPKAYYEGYWWLDPTPYTTEVQGWAYIDHGDEITAAQIALTLGVEVEHYEPI